MDAALYKPLFLTIVASLSIVTACRYLASPGYGLQEKGNGVWLPFLISVIFIYWIGMRPIHIVFGDTGAYALEYAGKEGSLMAIDWHSEWLWQWLMVGCKKLGLSVNAFFTVIEAGYILFILWAVKRFMPANSMIGMLFVWASLMFFAYGTNTIRNGLACSIVLLAMSYLLDGKKIGGIILCLMALGVHRSTALPIVSFVASFFIKDIKYAIYIWGCAILASLLSGNFISFFASLDFDGRMESYMNTTVAYKTSYRWDFLLYSSVPIAMMWCVCIKLRVEDNWYRILCITYCLANSFWILVIRVAFSDRFAYLSWFLYPIIIAYPLVNLPIWKDQDRKIGIALIAYSGFTVFMNLLYW